MPYGKLLKKLAKDKKMTYKKISEACSELGEPIAANYIKEVVNGRKRPPSEKKSRAIAKALNVKEELLVLEGYIDKAPKEIKKLLNNIRSFMTLAGLTSIENSIDKEDYNKLKEYMDKQNVSEFFIDILDEDRVCYIDNTHFNINRENLKLSVDYDNTTFFEISDNSMEPKIEKGSNVTIEVKSSYINGEIVALKIKGYDKIIYRMVYFGNGTITLTPFNDKDYHTITYNREDVEILGKVAKVIKSL